jgi:hypothetical protein
MIQGFSWRGKCADKDLRDGMISGESGFWPVGLIGFSRSFDRGVEVE